MFRNLAHTGVRSFRFWVITAWPCGPSGSKPPPRDEDVRPAPLRDDRAHSFPPELTLWQCLLVMCKKGQNNTRLQFLYFFYFLLLFSFKYHDFNIMATALVLLCSHRRFFSINLVQVAINLEQNRKQDIFDASCFTMMLLP